MGTQCSTYISIITENFRNTHIGYPAEASQYMGTLNSVLSLGLCSRRNYLYFSLCSPNQLKTCSISCPRFVFSSTPTQQSAVCFFSSLGFSSRVACTHVRASTKPTREIHSTCQG